MSATTTTDRYPLLSVPQPLVKLFSYFPLKTYPPSKSEKIPIVSPRLWIHPPPPSIPGQESVLSADIECLKWQAHIALRGLLNISVRWNISQDGALDGRLPNLQIPSGDVDGDGELLAAHSIPTWIDENVGALDDLEGYKDIESRDESHAWIALLEGDVHAALVSLLNLTSTMLSSQSRTRHWHSPHLPSSIIASSSYPLAPPNDPLNPSSCHHRLRFRAFRHPCLPTARIFPRTPSPHATVMQLPRFLNV